MDDVIHRLNAAVRASGKPRKTIAYDAGLSASKLSRLLAGELHARIADVEAVLAAIGLTMQSLYPGEAKADVRQALRTLAEYVDAHEAPARARPARRPPSRTARPFPVLATPNVVLFDNAKGTGVRIPGEAWRHGARHVARVAGDSMTGAGIEDGDLVFFKRARSKTPPRGAIVIIRVNESVYLKRYEEARGEKRLVSDNEAYRPIVLQPHDDVELYGIVVRNTSES